MSQQLINHSADLQRLVNEGYALQIVQGHLIVEEIPYLDELGAIKRGAFACPLDATAEKTLPPNDHVMSFSGQFPHDRHGQPIAKLGQTNSRCNDLAGRTFTHGFSNKPRDPGGHRNYRDFYEKITAYETIIVGEVQSIDPTATARVGALGLKFDDNAPFVFPDSASARAGTTELANRFANEIVAIIGVGGTGSFILDHVSKVPVSSTHLIDGDRFYPHNAFRGPGAPSRTELQPPQFKVDYYAARYRQMKNGIVAHPVALTKSHFSLLDAVTFAFLAIDGGAEKTNILDELERRKIPFVETGMGLHMTKDGIGGTLRAVLSTEDNREQARRHIPLHRLGHDHLYGANIQISDLNSLNADMAIQLWKAHRGFYINHGNPVWIYQVETQQFIRVAA